MGKRRACQAPVRSRITQIPHHHLDPVIPRPNTPKPRYTLAKVPDPEASKRPDGKSVVVPGNYDGVHLGHRALLQRAQAAAKANQLGVTALFFDPHPHHLLRPDVPRSLLTTPDRRRELLRAAGADHVETVAFDRTFAALSPAEFVSKVLVKQLAARQVIVGPDFRFGQGAQGTVETLATLGQEFGFLVDTVEPVLAGEGRVSSTRIRDAIAAGDVSAAAQLLTRYHDVEGTVVRGDQRGRTLGFPTANVQPAADLLLPPGGVYAVVTRVARKRHQVGASAVRWGVANLGQRPTFGQGADSRLEVHLLDFEGDIYDAHMRVAFVTRLREEMRFDGVDALKKQIGQDVTAARTALENACRAWWAH